MTPFPHRYEVALTDGPAPYARLDAAGRETLTTAPPAEFGGPGDRWSPEHLLLAAVESCFLFTLRAVARAAALPFSGLDVQGCGLVDRRDGVTRFTEIVLRVRLVVAPGTDADMAMRVLERSKRHCLVSASLSTPVTLDAEIVESPDGQPLAPLAAAPCHTG